MALLDLQTLEIDEDHREGDESSVSMIGCDSAGSVAICL
ncbi:SapB/AmfS family lanthipeptide [Kitasatospora sp. NPDC101235]